MRTVKVAIMSLVATMIAVPVAVSVGAASPEPSAHPETPFDVPSECLCVATTWNGSGALFSWQGTETDGECEALPGCIVKECMWFGTLDYFNNTGATVTILFAGGATSVPPGTTWTAIIALATACGGELKATESRGGAHRDFKFICNQCSG